MGAPDSTGLERTGGVVKVGGDQVSKDLDYSIPNFTLTASHILFLSWELTGSGRYFRIFTWHPDVSCFTSGIRRETKSEEVFSWSGKSKKV